MTDAQRPTTEITLLDRQYVIACPEDKQDKLDRAARYLDRAMQGIYSQRKVVDRERIAIMAALNIANELLDVLDEQRAGEKSLTELNQRLERALAKHPDR
ncbi:MAG TPA: cell division protein ZapA [Halomonas sp.]|nr:cell division protein ZapA [Halomonas sp.]